MHHVVPTRNGQLYQNYMRRKPTGRGAVSITRLHKRLYETLLRSRWSRPVSILEIGPGHSFFAEICVEAGHQYEFEDSSEAVTSDLLSRNFVGRLIDPQRLPVDPKDFEVIWLSHVLEHCPTWHDARRMLGSLSQRLIEGGEIVVIGPDALSWRNNFWNSDFSHGYPTTLRNVAQLLDDIGLEVVFASTHRGGFFRTSEKMIFAILTLIPHRVFDKLLRVKRFGVSDGLVMSWKTMFGWRQIAVIGRRQGQARAV